MVEKEEMIPTNIDINLTPDDLTKGMQQCEEDAASDQWQAPLDEVFTFPDVFRTSFLWQILLEGADITNEDWEGEERQWRCLPAQWQTLLNARLADFQAKVSDAEVFWQVRLDQFGNSDIKTKNALSKLEALKSGEGADSIILISRATGKEASPDVYARSVAKNNGVVKVSTSSRVQAYRLNVKKLTLEELGQEGPEQPNQNFSKSLRIISVTGRSRDIQEVRLHLSSLSLYSSGVLGGGPKAPKAPEAAKGEQQAAGPQAEGERERERERGMYISIRKCIFLYINV
jgi:hypothetical protein